MDLWRTRRESDGEDPPAFVGECAAVHALSLVSKFLDTTDVNPDIITVVAGPPKLRRDLSEWCNTGRMSLSSQAAPEIIQVCDELASRIPCPLVFNSVEWSA